MGDSLAARNHHSLKSNRSSTLGTAAEDHHRQQQRYQSQPQPQPQQQQVLQPRPGPLNPGQGQLGSRPGEVLGKMEMLGGGESNTEELRVRELEEARARASQMEKTMRWWSDCTANWREKWGKVRAERNKSREECRLLRAKLETVNKELNRSQRENQDISVEYDRLRVEYENLQSGAPSDNRQPPAAGPALVDNVEKEEDSSHTSSLQPEEDRPHQPPTMQPEQDRSRKQQSLPPNDFDPAATSNIDLMTSKIAMLEIKLDESAKTIKLERDEKSILHKSMERLQGELSHMRTKNDELILSRQTLLKELTHLRTSHKDELGRITSDLEDETVGRTHMDRRLAETRKELEKLHAENALEWGKRERLETEKLALERDNKKLKAAVVDLEESLVAKSRQAVSVLDPHLKALQAQLYDRNKELSDLTRTQAKFKKALQDKVAELTHTHRRAEQHDGEVKKLRVRVDELKTDLARNQDDVDNQSNLVRKLQRSLDEAQETNEGLQVQLEHLQSRLRQQQQASTGPFKRGGGSSLKAAPPSPDINNTDYSDEDDLDDYIPD